MVMKSPVPGLWEWQRIPHKGTAFHLGELGCISRYNTEGCFQETDLLMAMFDWALEIGLSSGFLPSQVVAEHRNHHRQSEYKLAQFAVRRVLAHQ